MSVKAALTVGFPLLVVGLYAGLVYETLRGDIGPVVLLAWIASPITFYLLALVAEKDPITQGGRGDTAGEVFKSVFSLRTQAWSFIFGDIVILPAAFAVAASKWNLGQTDREQPLWWWVVCLLVGVVAGVGFHFKMDKPAYVNAGYAMSLNSPTKLLHDFVTYPVLFGALLYVFGPLLFTPATNQWHWDGYVITIFVLVAIWFVLGAVFDGSVRQKKQTKIPWGHPKYDLQLEECVA